MAKKNAQPVTARKKERMGFTITMKQQLLAERAARRQVDIDTGRYRQTGLGRQGGSDAQNNRRERRQARIDLRRGDDD